MQCRSDISIHADREILLEGPESHFQNGKLEGTLQSEIEAWIAETQRFILDNKDAIVQRLSAS
jgi:hypothetical protein